MAIVLLLHLDVSQSLGNADAQAAFAKDGADAARLHRPMRSGDCLRKWLRTSGKWSGCRGLQRPCGSLKVDICVLCTYAVVQPTHLIADLIEQPGAAETGVFA